MLTIQCEKLQCAQSGETFPLWIMAMDGIRFFATEDIGPILRSPITLSEDDVTVILEWDRNSTEAPFIGPVLDQEIGSSSLFVHRLADIIRLEKESDIGREPIYTISLQDWLEKVKELEIQGD